LPNLLCGNLNGRRKANDNHRRERSDHSDENAVGKQGYLAARTPTDLVSLGGHDLTPFNGGSFHNPSQWFGVGRDYTANPNYPRSACPRGQSGQ
jgi:hypothetical protein